MSIQYSNIFVDSEKHLRGLSTPPDYEFEDSNLSNSMDDSMEIAAENDIMQRYDLNFDTNQDDYQLLTSLDQKTYNAKMNPLMTSMEFDEASLSINKEEIELRIDTTEESGVDKSLDYEKSIIGTIDLFDFSCPNLKQMNHNEKAVNRGRVGRCSFQNKNLHMINEESAAFDSPNLSIC